MNLFNKIEKILPEVQYPQRYIGNEIGIIHKKNSRIKIAFGFPDLYELGMSNLAIKIFYDLFAKEKEIAFERTFLPGRDMISKMAENSIPLFTLESFDPVDTYDVFGITFPSELLYINGLRMIELSNIPLYRKSRGEDSPLLIAGGPTLSNPIPLFPFFDIIFVGEAEFGFKKIIDLYNKYGRSEDFFKRISSIDGVIVPKNYKNIEKQGFNFPIGNVIKIGKWSNFSKTPPIDEVLIPLTRIGEARYEVELMRGCTQGCRFCSAGSYYRPHRERDVNKILSRIKKQIRNKATKSISLLSLSTGDYSQLKSLVKGLLLLNEDIKISLPSLRLDSLESEIVEQLGKRKITSLTFALEAGSERLRKVINKKITEADLFKMLARIKDKSWRTVKFYFMIGLPTETDEDIVEIINLIDRVRKVLTNRFQINVTVSIFAPKPDTPFENCDLITYDDYRRRISILKAGIHWKNVKIRYPFYFSSLMETVFARGDLNISKLLVDLLNKDNWYSEIADIAGQNNFERYLKNFKMDYWCGIVNITNKEFLKIEYEKALSGDETEDCFMGKCTNCGICNKALQPQKSIPLKTLPIRKQIDRKTTYRYLIRFKKIGLMRFISHNDLLYIVVRLLEMSGLEIIRKKGFARNEKLTSYGAIPIGIESMGEYIYLELHNRFSKGRMERFNVISPNGLDLIEAKNVQAKPISKAVKYQYIVNGKKKIIEINKKDGNFPSIKKTLLALENKEISISKIKKLDILFE